MFQQHHCCAITPQYATGLVFIGLVAVIWAASSVLIQFLYTSDTFDFHSPFLVTYIGVSLFTLWLPTHRVWQRWCKPGRRRSNGGSDSTGNSRSAPPPSSSLSEQRAVGVPYQTVGEEDGHADDDDTVNHNYNAHTTIDTDPQHAQAAHTTTTTTAAHSGYSTGPIPWTDADHLTAALQIAPVWFVANWTYNASLAWTSVTSSTVLASTGSLFAFLFAVATKDEVFNGTKLAGVVLGMVGSMGTAWNDAASGDSDNDGSGSIRRWRTLLWDNECASSSEQCPSSSTLSLAVWGDVLGLISAVGYGTYAVQTRVLCPKDESLYHMPLLLGYIGLLNLVVLSPIAVYQVLSGRADVAWIVVACLIVKGLFDNVLSDYLWLRAVMLTNATVATVGLGLTIPLAFASDLVMGQASNVLSTGQVVGALAVLAGFVLVNVGNQDERDEDALERSLAVVRSMSMERDDDDVSDEDSQHGQEVVTLPL